MCQTKGILADEVLHKAGMIFIPQIDSISWHSLVSLLSLGIAPLKSMMSYYCFKLNYEVKNDLFVLVAQFL